MSRLSRIVQGVTQFLRDTVACTTGVHITYVLACILFAATAFYTLRSTEKFACESEDGKWASTMEICITRSCFHDQSCGEWAAPGARCGRLKIGDPRSEVYFQLGMPLVASASTASWPLGKGSSERIVVQFKDERLTHLACPAE